MEIDTSLKMSTDTIEIQTKPGYKHTKLGWIPRDWAILTGKDISLKITKGSSPRWQGFSYQDTGVLFVTSENVRLGFMDISRPKYLPVKFNDKAKNSVLQKGDILINIVGASIGRSCIFTIDEIANINQAVCLLRPKTQFSSIYLSNFLQLSTSVTRLLNTQTESARPNLTLEDIRNFQFLLPPLPEQQKIAQILSTWDKAIEQQEQLIKKKERLKQGLMQQLLSGKKRFPGFDGKWEEYAFGDVFDFLKTYSFSRAQLTDEANVSDTLYFHYGDIHATYSQPIVNCTVTKVPWLLPDFSVQSSNSYLQDGDLIIADASEDYEGVGACIELSGLNGKKAISGLHTIAVRDKSGLTAQYFRAYILKNPMVALRVKQIATGSKVYGISKTNMTKLTIILPPIEEQEKIASILSSADEEIKVLKQRLDKLKCQKKGLMQKMLTGEVRVKV